MTNQHLDMLRVLASTAAPWVAGAVVVYQLRIPGVLANAVQTLVAKGRKTKNRTCLVGNYAPVDKELHVQDLQVIGVMPKDLRGAYMRNGSNPFYDPYASVHWFESDGMVHAVLIKDAPNSAQGCTIAYCNKYTATSRLAQELKAGKPIFAKFGDQEGVRGLVVVLLELLKTKTGYLDATKGTGTANTSIVYHAGKILALHEGDLPYQIRLLCDGLLETIGRLQVDPVKWGSNWPFTAHPKLDAATGHLHFLGYNIDQPLVKLGTLGAKGELLDSLQVDLPWTAMMHDMAITPHFKVLLQLPLTFEPQAMVKQNSLPLVYKPELPARIGLVPHGATSQEQVTWFELPSFMAFHVANAWEEGPLVKIYLCAMKSFDMAATEYKEELGSKLAELVLNRDTGKATMRQMTAVGGDFPVVHPDRQGVPTRYAWTATSDPADKQARNVGIAKHDLTAPEGKDSCCARLHYQEGCYGGEAYFVPSATPSGSGDGSDDGYLMVYVYHTAEDTSYLHVFSAKTMDSKPLASVKLPQRVPYGFHGTFVTQAQLAAAKSS